VDVGVDGRQRQPTTSTSRSFVNVAVAVNLNDHVNVNDHVKVDVSQDELVN